MEKNSKILKGSIFLAVGAFLAKLIGAVYRIPLTNLLGGEGLGLYQMVFPIYCVLLDFSGAGAPSAISKLISAKLDSGYGENLIKGSVRLFAIIGVIGVFVMAGLSLPLSIAQGNRKSFLGYIFLSPAVFFVAIISCYRGYFQGKMNMMPTAISQVIEQVVKLGTGLLIVYMFRYDLIKAVAGATFAVTLSEIVALTYLFITYKIYEQKHGLSYPFDKTLFKSQRKALVKYTVVVTLIGIAIPLSQVFDSFLFVNILSGYRGDATALYGLYSGAATTVINLPVAICYGVATVAIPAVSGAKSKSDKQKNSKKTLLLTLALSFPCAIFCYMFSPFIVKVLFGRLSANERVTTINLIRYLSINIVLLSFIQTSNAVLIGSGKAIKPLIGMGIGIAVKVILNILLLSNPNLNVYGGVIAVIACYFVACLINFIMILRENKRIRVKNAYKTTECG